MFPIPWYAIIFISIPETILIIQLGFSLFNMSVKWRITIIISVFTGILSWVVPRLMPVPGIHTILLILVTTFMISWLSRTKVWYSFIAVVCGAMILGVTESVMISLGQILAFKTINDLSAYPWLNIAVSLPATLVMATIFLLVKRFKPVLYDLSTEKSLNE